MSPGKPHCTAAARGERRRRPAPCGVRRQAHARKPGGGLAVQFKQRRYRPRTAPTGRRCRCVPSALTLAPSCQCPLVPLQRLVVTIIHAVYAALAAAIGCIRLGRPHRFRIGQRYRLGWGRGGGARTMRRGVCRRRRQCRVGRTHRLARGSGRAPRRLHGPGRWRYRGCNCTPALTVFTSLVCGSGRRTGRCGRGSKDRRP